VRDFHNQSCSPLALLAERSSSAYGIEMLSFEVMTETEKGRELTRKAPLRNRRLGVILQFTHHLANCTWQTMKKPHKLRPKAARQDGENRTKKATGRHEVFSAGHTWPIRREMTASAVGNPLQKCKNAGQALSHNLCAWCAGLRTGVLLVAWC
jgi:hypothetical protein